MTRGQKAVLAVGATLMALTLVFPPQHSSDRTEGWEVAWGLFALVLGSVGAGTALVWWWAGRPPKR